MIEVLMKRISLFAASIGVMIAGLMPVAAGQEGGGQPISMQTLGPGRVEAPTVLAAEQLRQITAGSSELQVISFGEGVLVIGSGSDFSMAIASPDQIAVSGFGNGHTFAYTINVPDTTLRLPDPTVTPGPPGAP